MTTIITNPDTAYIGKLISWTEPNREYRTMAKCIGTDCKPSLSHKRGRYLLVRLEGKFRYIDLDAVQVEVVA